MTDLLNIDDLHLEFHTYDGVVKVLAGVNLKMRRGDVLGLDDTHMARADAVSRFDEGFLAQ